MENQNNNSSLKTLIIVLSVLFALSLVYIYKLTVKNVTGQTAEKLEKLVLLK